MGQRTPPPVALQSFGRCWHGVYYVEKADYGGSHPSSAARSALSGEAGLAHGVPVRRSRTRKSAARCGSVHYSAPPRGHGVGCVPQSHPASRGAGRRLARAGLIRVCQHNRPQNIDERPVRLLHHQRVRHSDLPPRFVQWGRQRQWRHEPPLQLQDRIKGIHAAQVILQVLLRGLRL